MISDVSTDLSTQLETRQRRSPITDNRIGRALIHIWVWLRSSAPQECLLLDFPTFSFSRQEGICKANNQKMWLALLRCCDWVGVSEKVFSILSLSSLSFRYGRNSGQIDQMTQMIKLPMSHRRAYGSMVV